MTRKCSLKRIALPLIAAALAAATAGAALAACNGRSRSYDVSCWKRLNLWQYASASQSARCSEDGHSVVVATRLTLNYTDGTARHFNGKGYVEKQVPDGKVGRSAKGAFAAKCIGYTFPARSATHQW